MGDISTERSMEDILSSIKRIIAEEGDTVPARSQRRAARAVPAADPASRNEAVLELGDYAEDGEDESTSDAYDDPAPQTDDTGIGGEDVAAPRSIDTILSNRTAEATRGSLEALSKLVIKPGAPGADTLEGLVREMLRPMLSEWLDANLPELVEAMVQREIERITKG